MPTIEQMLYAQWMIVESTCEYILDNIEGTDYEEMQRIIETIHEGCELVQMQMKRQLQIIDDQESDCDFC